MKKGNFTKLFFLFLQIICIIQISNAQQAATTPATPATPQDKPAEFGIKFSGYVKADYMFDSRQTINLREGHFLLFPAPVKKGPDGKDINATINDNALAIQTRLKGTITGPDFFGMKTSGVIEGEFFGHSDADINGFRLRHAFVKLSGAKTEWTFGQYWHPMFITECFPEVYSFNTGVPFEPFSRNPQIRFNTTGKVKLIAALLWERDFGSRGPDAATSNYLRNSAVPDLHAQLQYGGNTVTAGVGLDYKTIRPRLSDLRGNKTDTKVSGVSATAYLKVKASKVTFKLQGTYGQNAADLLMLGGIAESKLDSSDIQYSPFNIMAAWVELMGGGTKIEWGLFAGYTKNLGTGEALATGGKAYTFGSSGTLNVASAYRVAPRIAFKSGKTKIGVELEYTAAQWGTLLAGKKELDTTNIDAVSNIRLLAFAQYSF